MAALTEVSLAAAILLSPNVAQEPHHAQQALGQVAVPAAEMQAPQPDCFAAVRRRDNTEGLVGPVQLIVSTNTPRRGQATVKAAQTQAGLARECRPVSRVTKTVVTGTGSEKKMGIFSSVLRLNTTGSVPVNRGAPTVFSSRIVKATITDKVCLSGGRCDTDVLTARVRIR